jgi:outer membrane immunogenic protein
MGGVAFGNQRFSQDIHFFDSNSDNAGSVNLTKTGWTAGAGAEYAFNRNWSAKLEYLHVDLGNVSFGSANPRNPAVVTALHSDEVTEDIVRAGVNYKLY